MTNTNQAAQSVASIDRRRIQFTLISIPLVTWALLFALFYPPEAPQRVEQIEAGYGEYGFAQPGLTGEPFDAHHLLNLQSELEERIQEIAPHIQRARVAINTGNAAAIQPYNGEPAVSVQVSSAQDLSKDSVLEIQRYIASKVKGVNPQSIIVLNLATPPDTQE